MWHGQRKEVQHVQHLLRNSKRAKGVTATYYRQSASIRAFEEKRDLWRRVAPLFQRFKAGDDIEQFLVNPALAQTMEFSVEIF